MYSQTCLYSNLYKTTNAESAQANSMQLLLYKTSTCLTQPATTFLLSLSLEFFCKNSKSLTFFCKNAVLYT